MESAMPRLLPPVLLLVVIALMAVVHRQFEFTVVVPEGVRLASVALIGLGLAFASVARIQFFRAQTTINTFDRPRQLVTSGIFRWSRNPMYVGLSLIAVGCALACGAVSSVLLAALFVVITDRVYIRFEEGMLRATFGDAFERYERTTRRWL
jgi:protein-S-isoprenylcysteine O-methyltransferase Ste14